MKRLIFFLCLVFTTAEAQISKVDWYKSTNDTLRVANANWGILAKFLTFPDGTKLTTQGISGITGLQDSLTAKLNRTEFLIVRMPYLQDSLTDKQNRGENYVIGVATGLSLTPSGSSGRFGWWTRTGGQVGFATGPDTAAFGTSIFNGDFNMNIHPDSITTYKTQLQNNARRGIWWRNATTNDIYFLRLDTAGMQLWRRPGSSFGTQDWLQHFSFGYLIGSMGHQINDWLVISGTKNVATANPTISVPAMLFIQSDVTSAAKEHALIGGKQNSGENLFTFLNTSSKLAFEADSAYNLKVSGYKMVLGDTALATVKGLQMYVSHAGGLILKDSTTRANSLVEVLNEAGNGRIFLYQSGNAVIDLNARATKNSYFNTGGIFTFGSSTAGDSSVNTTLGLKIGRGLLVADHTILSKSLKVGGSGMAQIDSAKVTGEGLYGYVGGTGYVAYNPAFAAQVTAGTGDSIQVSVTGVTANSIILATYATATDATDISPAIVNVQTGKFTIYATNTKKVNYWIPKL